MVSKQTSICCILSFLGFADLLTTVFGVTAKGIAEGNPLFTLLIQTNVAASWP